MHHRILLLIVGLAGLVLAAQAQDPIVLGDSLSDVENRWIRTGGPSNSPQAEPNPKYYPADPQRCKHPFSNGCIWPTLLSENHPADFPSPLIKAEAGASACSANTNTNTGNLPAPYSVEEQYAQLEPGAATGKMAVLWAGGNDYINALRSVAAPRPPGSPAECIRRVCQNLLRVNSARGCVIANLQPLDTAPGVRKLRDKYTGGNKVANLAFDGTLRTTTLVHNAQIAAVVLQLRTANPGKTVVLFDLYRIIDNAQRTRPPPFTNVYDSYQPLKVENNVVKIDKKGTTNGNPDQYLYWDGVHFTTKAHQVLIEPAMYTALKSS